MQVKVIRQRRKTISARVIDLDTLEVRVPLFTTPSMIDVFLEEKSPLISKAFAKYKEKEAKRSSNIFYYLGKAYVICYKESDQDQESIR